MADQKNGISWTDETWNPTRGCRRVSPGCSSCYAERVAARFSGPGMPYEGLARLKTRGGQAIAPGDEKLCASGEREARWTGKGRFVAEHLADPLRWKRPRRIFVNSMSDLFFEEFSNEEIAAVFGVMAAAPRHTFQVLTKRPERMREWFAWVENEPLLRLRGAIDSCITLLDNVMSLRDLEVLGRQEVTKVWPLPNVWLGVSVEDQQRADERIPLLLETSAAVRFISAEPLLGPIDLRLPKTWGRRSDGRWGCNHCCNGDRCDNRDHRDRAHCTRCGGTGAVDMLDWVIVGGESGPGARPMNLDWARAIVRQCQETGVAVHVPGTPGPRHDRHDYALRPPVPGRHQGRGATP